MTKRLMWTAEVNKNSFRRTIYWVLLYLHLCPRIRRLNGHKSNLASNNKILIGAVTVSNVDRGNFILNLDGFFKYDLVFKRVKK
jgi:hypothetical protein